MKLHYKMSTDTGDTRTGGQLFLLQGSVRASRVMSPGVNLSLEWWWLSWLYNSQPQAAVGSQYNLSTSQKLQQWYHSHWFLSIMWGVASALSTGRRKKFLSLSLEGSDS